MLPNPQDTRNVYLVTELLSGAQLAQLLRDRGQLDEASVCSVIRQLAQAVYDLHRIGVIHRCGYPVLHHWGRPGTTCLPQLLHAHLI